MTLDLSVSPRVLDGTSEQSTLDQRVCSVLSIRSFETWRRKYYELRELEDTSAVLRERAYTGGLRTSLAGKRGGGRSSP